MRQLDSKPSAGFAVAETRRIPVTSSWLSLRPGESRYYQYTTGCVVGVPNRENCDHGMGKSWRVAELVPGILHRFGQRTGGTAPTRFAFAKRSGLSLNGLHEIRSGRGALSAAVCL
jgi:hypothetical protein